MATDTKQMSREELQQLAEQTLKRRAQQRTRQEKIRKAKRESGLRSSTIWHPASPDGCAPCLVFAPTDIAKHINQALQTGKKPTVKQCAYKREIEENGMSRLTDVNVWVLE